MFSTLSKTEIIIHGTFILLSANALYLDKVKFLSSGNRLKLRSISSLPGLVDRTTGTCLRYRCSRSWASLLLHRLPLSDDIGDFAACGLCSGLCSTNESANEDNTLDVLQKYFSNYITTLITITKSMCVTYIIISIIIIIIIIAEPHCLVGSDADLKTGG